MTEEILIPSVDSKVAIHESDDIILLCKSICYNGKKTDLAWRWELGKLINEMSVNTIKYEKGILTRLSEEIDISISELSRYRKFFNEFSDMKAIESAANRGYSWSHFKLIDDVADKNLKEKLKTQLNETEEAPKVVDLQATIASEKDELLNKAEKSSKDDADNAKETKSGGSPVKPLNSAVKHADALCDNLGSLLIALKDGIDFDSEKQTEKFNGLMIDLKQRLAEVIEYTNQVNAATE
jgi:hypothetical protein